MNKYVLSLSMAALMTIPVAAQQNQSSAPSDQPQAQPQTQAQPSQAADAATGKEPLKYERHEGFWGKVNPFAR